MNAVVVYDSATGFTQRYAQWIAEELRCTLRARARARVEDLVPCDAIVYGGRLHAGGIAGVGLIRNNLRRLAGRKIAVFGCGAAPDSAQTVADVVARNFTPEQQTLVRVFYLRGGFDFSRLRGLDRLLMTLMRWAIAHKQESRRTADERGMLAAFDTPADFTDRARIRPLVDYVTS